MALTIFEKLVELINEGVPCVSVTIVDVSGSVPNERGAKMLVTASGRVAGTVGGGKIESRTIEEAKRLLDDVLRRNTHFVEWSLNRDVGMTCGGSVKLYFEAFNVGTWRIFIFGAGHVANALVTILEQLDCRITCLDPRAEWIARLPSSPKLRTITTADMPSQVAGIPDDAYVVLMTMGHTTDKPILLEILRNARRFPYLGVIGSKAKAVRLKQDVAEAQLPAEAQEAFICPIGLPFGTNDPAEIAVSVAAQLIAERDRQRGTKPVHLKSAGVEE
ncbi:MAG: xanthine dehydrogenase accessory protein XdhC [Acidobacteriota bacterium]